MSADCTDDGTHRYPYPRDAISALRTPTSVAASRVLSALTFFHASPHDRTRQRPDVTQCAPRTQILHIPTDCTFLGVREGYARGQRILALQAQKTAGNPAVLPVLRYGFAREPVTMHDHLSRQERAGDINDPLIGRSAKTQRRIA